MKNLFVGEKFISHDGNELSWKIECDALKDADWETLAKLISNKVTFGEVWGIPKGGKKLEKALKKYRETIGDWPTLLVDDVLTTGGSMNEALKLLDEEDVIGAVVFARGKCPSWVFALFYFV